MNIKEIRLIKYAIQSLLVEWDDEIKEDLESKDITKQYLQDKINEWIEKYREKNIGYEL
jgi:hypothetical protein